MVSQVCVEERKQSLEGLDPIPGLQSHFYELERFRVVGNPVMLEHSKYGFLSIGHEIGTAHSRKFCLQQKWSQEATVTYLCIHMYTYICLYISICR